MNHKELQKKLIEIRLNNAINLVEFWTQKEMEIREKFPEYYALIRTAKHHRKQARENVSFYKKQLQEI